MKTSLIKHAATKKALAFFMIAGLTTMSMFAQRTSYRAVTPSSDFTGIEASGAFDITVAKGTTASFAIDADEDLKPYVRSEVKNGVLHLSIDSNTATRNRKIKTVKASVVVKNLDRVSLSGACKIVANDLFTPTSFTGDCSGSSDMTVNLETEQLNLQSSGASKMKIRANVTGDTKINTSGSSNIQGELNANTVKFKSGGSCKVDLTGSAKDVAVDMSGSSNFKAEKFAVRTATVKSSGSSNVTLDVAESLDVNSSGASTVNYKGSPAVNAGSSGSSRVRKY
jgi:hypothetical protein